MCWPRTKTATHLWVFCLLTARCGRSGIRLSDQAADSLTHQLESTAVDEYVRGFGLHVGLKLLLPIVMPLKVGGAAVSLASGKSTFLLRDFASRLGCWLPIYGGKDSRTELMAITLVNVIAEGLDLWLSLTNPNRSKASSEAEIHRTAEILQPVITAGRWDRLAAEHIRLMQESTTTTAPILPAQRPVSERRVA